MQTQMHNTSNLQMKRFILVGPLATQSYLQVDRIIQAAIDTGSQAVHPGYGFLSENDQFALACQQHNICFIGPPVDAILAMGLKATSKALMEKSRCPFNTGLSRNQPRC